MFKIKKILRESLLNEIKFGINELPQNTILINNHHNLTLYNLDYLKSEDPLEGVLGHVSMLFEGNYASIDQVAAIKGYGPFMYELSAQYAYPGGLQSSRDANTNDKAIRMWEYFTKNSDSLGIDLEILEPNDDGYVECNERGCVEDFPNLFKMINTAIYCSDTNDLYSLTNVGEEFIEDEGEKLRDLISGYGNAFFNDKY